MQKTIVTALAILASTAAATASDLPSKAKAPEPLPTMAQTQYYFGGSLGGDLQKATVYSGGVVAGYNALPFLSVEGTYDLTRPQDKFTIAKVKKFNYENTFAFNVVPQYKVPATDITAYAFGGLGYRWNTINTIKSHSTYNFGGGLKYEFAKNFELDGRYARIDEAKKLSFNSQTAEDRATFGVNYKF